jgi:predicted adenylyl cyclase CyaB
MPKNLEIKVKLTSHKEVKEILKRNKIPFKELLLQKDIYYKVDKGFLKLRVENDKQTLIFYDRNEKSKKRWSDYHLLEIDNTDTNKYLRRFLDVQTIVNKKRELYLYKGTRIHLDYVKGLGCFLELETQVINGLADAEERFSFMMDLLKLKDKKEIRASYKDLLLAKDKK